MARSDYMFDMLAAQMGMLEQTLGAALAGLQADLADLRVALQSLDEGGSPANAVPVHDPNAFLDYLTSTEFIDLILCDDSGNVLADDNGNLLTEG